MEKKNFESEEVYIWGCPHMGTIDKHAAILAEWVTNWRWAMKAETRKKYEEVVWGGQAMLRQIMNEGKLSSTADQTNWQECWASLDAVGKALQSPVPHTKTCLTQINNTMIRVRRLAGENVLEGQAEVEDEIAPASGTPSAHIIRRIQKAAKLLIGAVDVATRVNIMADGLPVFIEVKKIATELNALPRDLMKVRGLENWPIKKEKEDESGKGSQDEAEPSGLHESGGCAGNGGVVSGEVQPDSSG